MRLLSGLFVLFCVACGCAAEQIRAERSPSEDERRCAPPEHPPRLAAPGPSSPSPGAGPGEEHGPPALPGFSLPALKIAHIIGVDDLLARLVELESDQGRRLEPAHVAMLELRQQLSDRMLLVSLDIASVSAEINCQKERADQLGDRLEEEQDKKIMQLTIFAIMGGALVGILSGGLNLAGEDTAAAAGAISGGVLETAFGGAALVYEARHDFGHRRNLLREIWNGPEQPALFPLSVWRYVNAPASDPPLTASLREIVIAEWRRAGRFGKQGSETERKRTELFFGDGGTYTIEELRARSAMLDLLRAHIALMSQDLNLLVRELLMHRTIGLRLDGKKTG